MSNNLFTQNDEAIVDEIIISGNKRTKDFIILRELDFKVNDTISLKDSSQIIELNQNKIFNTELFISSEIAFIEKGNQHISVLIAVKERWYIFPFPIFALADRNLTEWGQQSNYSFSRIDWGAQFEHANFRGRKENLQVVLQTGFTKKYELFHAIPYVNKTKTIGLNYGISYSTNKNVSYLANIDNKRLFLSSDDVLRKRFRVGASATYRKQFFTKHQVSALFHNNSISQQLLNVNPQYLGNKNLKQQYIEVFYKLEIDKTNINYYPTKGWSLTTGISQNGLGIFNNTNFTEMIGSLAAYKEIKPWLIIASRASLKSSTGIIQPYLLQEGLGYEENFVRGFEPYVIDAQHFLMNRTELKFKIISYTTSLSKILKAEEFQTIPNTIYFNIYNDTGYAKNDNPAIDSPLANTWLQGYGVGVDLVSFYDIVMRMEYSFASNKTSGFFIHFGKAI